MFPSVSYGRELPPKSMYLAFILTLFILDAWLYVLHSFFFLFILYSCLYVNAYISHGFSIHSYSCFNFFLVFFLLFQFWDDLFRFFSVIPISCILIATGSYLIIFQYEISLHQTINQQTPSMKPNQWRRIRFAWIYCCIMMSGGTTIATIAAPIKQPSSSIVRN